MALNLYCFMNYNKYRGANQKILYPDLQKKCYHRRRANMTPEELNKAAKSQPVASNKRPYCFPKGKQSIQGKQS